MGAKYPIEHHKTARLLRRYTPTTYLGYPVRVFTQGGGMQCITAAFRFSHSRNWILSHTCTCRTFLNSRGNIQFKLVGSVCERKYVTEIKFLLRWTRGLKSCFDPVEFYMIGQFRPFEQYILTLFRCRIANQKLIRT